MLDRQSQSRKAEGLTVNTFASLFTGGGGADYSARRQGFTHLWGIEYDAKIASVAELNGFSAIVADICAVDFAALAAPYWLHMSPPCTNASQANANAGETPLDMALAHACIRAIEALRPRRISLENVWGYRNFASFQAILAALASAGYSTGFWHLNAADYGIPQTRKRLCLVASLDHTPRKPLPTHERRPNLFDMFALLPWNGWYAAIEDLIPGLPDSAFAPWQLERLPEHLKTMLFSGNSKVSPRQRTDPAMTLMAGRIGTAIRAFVIDCQESGSASGLTIRQAEQPMYTVSATMEPRRPARAFIIGGGNTNTTEERPRLPRYDNDPTFTVSGSSDRDRAYVGRVVKITKECLRRFNGLGDDYLLPASNTLACTVLGNMHILQECLMLANP